MLNKVSKKYALSGLLFLLVAGAVLFFAFRAFQDVDSIDSLPDFSESNHPPAEPGPEGLVQPTEEVPQEVIENSMSELSEADQQKFQSFLDISKSGKDNDPRIDKDLKNLSPELKKQLMNYYRNLAPERRNERGFVSFLIARDLKTSEDIDFLREVASEEPCLSMADCKILTPRDPHLSAVDEVSLNYPQLAILYRLDSQLGANPNMPADQKSWIASVVLQLMNSRVPKVREKAEQIQKKYSL